MKNHLTEMSTIQLAEYACQRSLDKSSVDLLVYLYNNLRLYKPDQNKVYFIIRDEKSKLDFVQFCRWYAYKY